MKLSDDAKRLGNVALVDARTRWGAAAWSMLGEDLQRSIVGERAARLVLVQMVDEYKPAQEILKAAFEAYEESHRLEG